MSVKMVRCNHCGTEMASSAKFCPSCGAKNNKPIFKRWWFWVIIVVLLALIGGAAGGSDSDNESSSSESKSTSSSEKSKDESQIEYETVDLKEMFDQLDANALNAANTYEGKNVEFTGVVRTIDSDGSYVSIEPKDAVWEFRSIHAKTGSKKEVLDQIAKLNSDDVVTVKGKITDVGEVLGYYLNIDSIEKIGVASTDSEASSENTAVEEQPAESNAEGATTTTDQPENTAVEQSSTEPAASPSADVEDSSVPVGQRNALKSAKTYLRYSSFSFNSLYDQLIFEGYTEDEAAYAVQQCGADWNDQALKKAKSYLDFTGFSYNGLYEQLIDAEKFTEAQAEYAVQNCGADWNAEAAKKAKSYMEISSFSRESLIDQLLFEGFSQAEAEYGVSQVGY